MIAWSIQAAITSECFDRVIVSTDDQEIAEIAKHWGAEVPFMRPEELSDDHTPTVPVIAHAIASLEALGETVTETCCIYPTAPFVRPQDIDLALTQLLTHDTQYVLTVTSYPYPIQRALKVNSTTHLEMINPHFESFRSQDLEESCHDAGQFYWGKTKAWTDQIPLLGAKSMAYFLPRHLVQDIDTPEDWVRAELMFEALKIKNNEY